MGPQFDTVPETDNLLARGVTIGRYVVLALVGRGGMGEVYAAYDPELDRKVAIKLLRARGSQDCGPPRLLREAQAIAKLSHPNVVVVYDVGTFSDQVFIAMEFVEGRTVGYWMNAAARRWPEVLKIFTAAGRGLAAAHDKQVVHRDFKPDNVMLSVDGQVRVMDFGLARLVTDPTAARLETPSAPVAIAANGIPSADRDQVADLDSTNVVRTHDSHVHGHDRVASSRPASFTAQLTQEGALIGTPAYMAPEQFLCRPTDARTDQFSYCVALYEALYSQRPFAGSTLFGLTANVVQGNISPEPARSDVPPWIRKVVLRGLSVAPDDRWPSMDHLLDELEKKQFLAGQRGFAEGAVAKLAGIWEAPSPHLHEETVAKASIRRAFIETDRPYAATVFENVSRILDQYATAWTAMYISTCEATHVRGEQSTEVLDLRMSALQGALEDLRALCLAFRSATPKVVENAVSAASTLQAIERCADVDLLRAVIKPPLDPGTRETVDRLRGQLADFRTLSRVGRLAEALAMSEPLEKAVRQTGYQPLLAEALLEIGVLSFQRGEPQTAVPMYEEAVWTAELCHHEEIVAEAATRLVGAVAEQSRFDAVEIWSKLAETHLLRMGKHDGLWGWLFNNLASSRHLQGRLDEAVDLARRAITAKEKSLGPDNPDVGISIGNLGLYQSALGELNQAASCMERALTIFDAGLGPEHPTTALYLSNYGELLNQLARFSDARQIIARALAIFERQTDPDGIFVTTALTALGIGYLGDGMIEQALPILERAVRNREANDPDLVRLAEVHFALARALAESSCDLLRARELALRAQDEYARAAQTPATERERAHIGRWLLTHPSRAA